MLLKSRESFVRLVNPANTEMSLMALSPRSNLVSLVAPSSPGQIADVDVFCFKLEQIRHISRGDCVT